MIKFTLTRELQCMQGGSYHPQSLRYVWFVDSGMLQMKHTHILALMSDRELWCVILSAKLLSGDDWTSLCWGIVCGIRSWTSFSVPMWNNGMVVIVFIALDRHTQEYPRQIVSAFGITCLRWYFIWLTFLYVTSSSSPSFTSDEHLTNIHVLAIRVSILISAQSWTDHNYCGSKRKCCKTHFMHVRSFETLSYDSKLDWQGQEISACKMNP